MEAVRSRDSTLRPSDHGRSGLLYRLRRVHAGWRDRTPGPQARTRQRQPRVGRRCQCRPQLVRASAEENPELFWALRGGGGNFGVVPSLHLAVHPVGPTVLGGVIFYPADQAAQVISGWREVIADAPEELTSMINLTAAPPLPFLPESVHGNRVAVVIACYAGD